MPFPAVFFVPLGHEAIASVEAEMVIVEAAVVLAFAVAAVLVGADSVTAVSEWAADVPAEVLAALDGEAVAAAFGTWLIGQVMSGVADAAALLIALDGKTV